MLVLPQKYKESIQQIITWHLKTYVPDKMFNVPVKRILKRLEKETIVQLEDKELYYLNECVDNARRNAPECGVEQTVLDEIFDWVYPEYRKTKQSNT